MRDSAAPHTSTSTPSPLHTTPVPTPPHPSPLLPAPPFPLPPPLSYIAPLQPFSPYLTSFPSRQEDADFKSEGLLL